MTSVFILTILIMIGLVVLMQMSWTRILIIGILMFIGLSVFHGWDKTESPNVYLKNVIAAKR